MENKIYRAQMCALNIVRSIMKPNIPTKQLIPQRSNLVGVSENIPRD